MTHILYVTDLQLDVLLDLLNERQVPPGTVHRQAMASLGDRVTALIIKSRRQARRTAAETDGYVYDHG